MGLYLAFRVLESVVRLIGSVLALCATVLFVAVCFVGVGILKTTVWICDGVTKRMQ
jgi:hypothetical protein